MPAEFTAVVEQDGNWFIAYCPEVPGAIGRDHPDRAAPHSLPPERGRHQQQRFRLRSDGPGRSEAGPPVHKNDAYEETLYGIEGVLTWTIDGKAIELAPRQALCIPRGAVHRHDNFGTEDAKQLSIVPPAIMGPAYFREASEVVNAAGGGPPDAAKMVEVFRRHGMTIAAPPPAR